MHEDLQDDVRPELNAEGSERVQPSKGNESAISLGTVPVGLYLATVVLVAVVLNLNTLHNAFHLDDMRVIVDNRNLATPSALLRSLAVNPSRALLLLSFGYNLWLGGFNPVGFHIVNVALHAAVCALVFLLTLHFARNSTDLTRGTIPPRVAAFVAATLFACHPLNSETVNYISARSSSMATCFYLLALLSFIHYSNASAQRTIRFWYAVSILSFLLGLASKETVITLPVMLLVYDLLYVSKFRPSRFVRRLVALPHGPFWAIVAVALAVQWFVVGLPSPAAKAVWANLMTQAHVVLNYLQLALLPLGLTPAHSVPDYTRLFEPTTLVAVLTICALVTLAAVLARDLPALTFAVLWYFVTLLPSSSVIPLGTAMNEHRAYLPFSMVVMLAPMGIAALLRLPSLRERRREVGMAVVVALAALSLGTVMRNRDWRSDLTLWTDAVEKSASSDLAQTGFGKAMLLRGRTQEAVDAFDRALELNPDNWEAMTHRGLALERVGRLDDALAAHERAIELDPADPRAYLNYATTLQAAGRLERALAEYQRALALDPDMTETYLGLATVYRRMGWFDEALRAVERAAELSPRRPLVVARVREMHYQIRTLRERKTRLLETISDGGGKPELYVELGSLYLAERDLGRAEEAFNHALEEQPSYGPALMNLGDVHMFRGNPQDAIPLYQRAAQFDEFATAAYGRLVSAYMANGQQPEARRALESLERVSGREFPALRERVEGAARKSSEESRHG